VDSILVEVAASLVVSALAAIRALFASRRVHAETSEATADKTLEERLDELAESMRRSARLVEEVTSELDARAATAKRLKEEAETAKALADLHREHTEAVRRMLDAELGGATRRIRRDSITIGIASFIAGGGVTFAITHLVRPVH
jgi:flagellar motility protein MotE (MotC chaperone)